ncbi:MAG: hypothetical protein WBN89_01830 [Prochlorococcaceae cyanobacterium]
MTMANSCHTSGTESDGRLDDSNRDPQQRRPDLSTTLRGMEQRLRRHSALEDLGPLFGPEAQGRQP